jgi:hypothetical protein
MSLENIRGEQDVLGNIIKIFARRPVSEYNSVDKQKRYVDIIHKKLPPNNIFRQDIEALEKKSTTVKEWISYFKRYTIIMVLYDPMIPNDPKLKKYQTGS